MRRGLVTVVVLVGLVATGGPASAAWNSGADGSAWAAATTMPSGATPTAIVSGRSVAVEWSASVFASGPSVDGYIVKRYASSGAEQSVLDECSGTISVTLCTEQAVPAGSWQYSVTPKQGSWVGQESAKSQDSQVSPPSFGLTPSSPMITNLPATLDGTITGFVDGEILRFRLDSPSGPVLSGTVAGAATPAPVPTGGSASVTVSIPTGTSDAAHTVYAVASPSGESVGAGFSVDATSPALTDLEMSDVDADGRVDLVTADFSEAIVCSAPCMAPWSLANVPSGGSLASVSISGSRATLQLTEGAGAPDTGIGTFSVSLAAGPSGIRDAAGNPASFAATAPEDGASPVPVGLAETNGGTKDGEMQALDTLSVTFSESLAAGSVPPTTAVTESDPAGSGSDTLTVAGVSNGALNTGSDGYVKNNYTSNGFSSSLVTLSGGDKVLTVTVAGACSPLGGPSGCAANLQAGGPGTLVFVPAATITDAAGNSAAGSVSATFKLF